MIIKAIVAILGGLMASYSLIVNRRPESKEYLDKLRPYQEWLGVILIFWGIRGILRMFSGSHLINSSALDIVMFGAELIVGFYWPFP